MKICFDSEKYEELQSQKILERVQKFNGKLYMEIGGKLFDDLHASRVLPGFRPDSKVKILQKLSDKTEIIMVVSCIDIERKRIRADYDIAYDSEVIRQLEKLRGFGLYVSSVVLTMYNGQKSADVFSKKLKSMGETVYIHRPTLGYPDNVDLIVSEAGYGANPYIKTTRPIVVVTAPGSGSGKMATCLSQLYHENARGLKSGYAKYETFPIWNLPVDHPVNLAYEAATADLKDKNMIDTYHLKAYGQRVTNYNRDLESFAILKSILYKITGNNKLYLSPTDMGVNMAGYAITDMDGVKQASNNEIIRRYYKALCDNKLGNQPISTAETIKKLMRKHGININGRGVIDAANSKSKQVKAACIAIELNNGKIICGKTTELLSCSSSVVLNSLKELAGIEDRILLLGSHVLEPMLELKKQLTDNKNAVLDLSEVLSALAICSSTDKFAKLAFSKLEDLAYLEAHSSHMLQSDLKTLKRLKINISSEPEYITIQ